MVQIMLTRAIDPPYWRLRQGSNPDCWYHRVWGLIAIKGRVNSVGVFRDDLLARKIEELQVL
jgi:hypothetical protein